MVAKLFHSFIFSLTLVSFLDAAIGISGTSLNNATGLSDGEVGVYIISSGAAFSTVEVSAGANIFESATYGNGFTVLGSNTASEGFGATTLASGHSTSISFFGNSFAVFVFEASTTAAISGDTYSVWTDSSWTLPSTDGVSFQFDATPTGDQIQQLSGDSSFVGSVVPEPSTFAALSGLLALTWVMLRRRHL